MEKTLQNLNLADILRALKDNGYENHDGEIFSATYLRQADRTIWETAVYEIGYVNDEGARVSGTVYVTKAGGNVFKAEY